MADKVSIKRISKASVRAIVARVIRDQRRSKAAMTAKGLSMSQRLLHSHEQHPPRLS